MAISIDGRGRCGEVRRESERAREIKRKRETGS